MLFLNISPGKAKCLERTGSHQRSLVQGHTQWALSTTASGVTCISQSLLLCSLNSPTQKLWFCLRAGLHFCHFLPFPFNERVYGTGQLLVFLLPPEVSAPVADSTTLLCPLGEKMRNRKLIPSNGWWHRFYYLGLAQENPSYPSALLAEWVLMRLCSLGMTCTYRTLHMELHLKLLSSARVSVNKGCKI